MYIDTHAHILPTFYTDIEDVIEKIRKSDIKKVINIGTTIEESEAAIKICRDNPDLFAVSIGIHPDVAKTADLPELNKQLAELEKLILESGDILVAIGEAGYDLKDISLEDQPEVLIRQKHLFAKQIELAEKNNLPLIIHCRYALPTLITHLTETTCRRGVLHSADGTVSEIQEILRLGFYVSFNGILTFKNAEHIRNIANVTDISRILLETDSPFLTPVPYRGKQNDSTYIPYTYSELAKIKNLPESSLRGILFKNAEQLFHLELNNNSTSETNNKE